MFDVKEYVPPKYDVSVKAPDFLLLNDEKIKGRVCAPPGAFRNRNTCPIGESLPSATSGKGSTHESTPTIRPTGKPALPR